MDMTKIQDMQRVLAMAVMTVSEKLGEPLTSDHIAEIVNRFQPALHYTAEEADYLLKSLETQYITTMGVGVSLIDPEQVHDDEWYQKYDITWDNWNDYERLLLSKGWSPRVITSMNLVTNRILGLLKYPLEPGDWERRGLVIGHVQSGKTSNYIGLITKAADAGYKFIIVIAGIHNNLRTQTQERIDEGFIGRNSRTRELIGVGARVNRSMPVTVTTTESDFNRSLARRFIVELKSLNKTFILVIKKNVSTLHSLYGWLKELNTHAGLEKITDIPMLLIDDEADHASINTNKPELDPTKTNKAIRSILDLFKKRCYVGYTATPFANIFIDPDTNDPKLGRDLFPEHFIHALDAPSNYFGSEKLFLDEDRSDDFIRTISDGEDWLPLQHKKDFPVNDLSDSLKFAIHTFVLSRAIRNLRGQRNQHCSMLVNVSRFVSVQREIRSIVHYYLERLKNAVRFNYRLPPMRAIEDELIAQIYGCFQSEYANAGFSWDQVLAELDSAVSPIQIFLVNSKSDEALDYTTYTKEGNALTAIVLGGLSLSRGLTIEGLTISYVYRNSKMYDTLMQMGRWFGYRDQYEDLCRVYMSEESYGWYSHIAEATEELRMQIHRMRREGKKPGDFGLYVRAHPDSLTVTALNKMRYTENRELRVSYDGKLLESHIIPESIIKTRSNHLLLDKFFELLRGRSNPITDSTNSYLFKDVPWEDIYEFVLGFRFHDDLIDHREYVPRYIQETADLYPLWDVTFRSLKGKGLSDGQFIAAQERNVGHTAGNEVRKPVMEPGWYVGNKNKVSGNSMFDIGLTDEQVQTAFANATEANRKKPIYSDYTNARGKPLLMLHLLDLVDKQANDTILMSNVPALSISFPNSSTLRTVEYVVSPVWLKLFDRDQYDSILDEDDYDLEQQ